METGLIYEERHCPVCVSGKLRLPVYAAAQAPDGRECKYVKCPVCGLIYMNPAPTPKSLAIFYRDVYCTEEYRRLDGYSMPDYETERAVAKDVWRNKLGLIRDYAPWVKRLYDVGCGIGGLIEAALAAGWEAGGCEASAAAVEFMRKHILPGVVNHTEFPDHKLIDIVNADVVTMFEFIEHAADPLTALAAASNMVNPGGYLFLTFPDADAAAGIREMSNLSDWIGWKPPTHLQFFGMEQMAKALNMTGWRPEVFMAAGGYAAQSLAIARRR